MKLAAFSGGLVMLSAEVAFAQDDQVVQQQQPVVVAQPVPPPPPTAPLPPPTPVARSTESGPSDHARVVRRLGLHYFGGPTIGTLDGTGMASANGTTVPTIGFRYWFMERLGLEAGLGLGFMSGSLSMTAGGVTMNAGVPGETIFGIQGGIPIVVADFHHIVFFFDPFVSFYYGYGALDVNPGGGTNSYRLNSMQLHLGATANAEVHLGFMHLPQVSIEARFGVQLNIQNDSLDVYMNGNQANTTNTQYSFGTTIGDFGFQSIFLSSVAATYYF